MRKNSGFSYLELGIVLVIIGAIFVGFNFGNNFLQQSSRQQLIGEMVALRSGFSGFIDKFQALPGDMVQVDRLADRNNTAVAGNGNFIIDSDSEEMQLWVHLASSGFIDGVFSGLIADRYVIATDAIAGGVPHSDYSDNAGYGVIQSTEDLQIILGVYSTTRNDLSVISPEELGQIDLKIDDGKPSSGGLIAANGNGDSGCITTGEYSASDSKVCIAQLAMYKAAIAKAVSSAEDCSGATIGDFSYGNLADCPANNVGRPQQTCYNTTSGTTTSNNDDSCRLEQCNKGLDVAAVNSALTAFSGLNTRQSIATCPNSYSNFSEIQCNAGGSLTYTTACTVNTSQNCINNQTFSLPCDFDQKGIRPYYCSSGSLTLDSGGESCSAIESGETVGVTRTTEACSGANADYTGNMYYEAAIAPSSSTVPFDAAYNEHIASNQILAFNECVPDYNSIAGCSGGAGTIVDIGCAPGERGSHFIRCVNTTNSRTIHNSCEKVTCNGAPLRSIRVSTIGKQARDDNCMPLQVCALVAADRAMWVEAKGHCHTSAGRCPSYTDTNYLRGPSLTRVDAGSTATPSCSTSVKADRLCLDGGIWGPAVDGGELCN